ncbi:MAG: molybdopterin-dependent oxidoreductase [Alphaproteobacteria bacterium]|nr:molybdopterin-dependent oxidoreductase [Alphaproteobacteria bacterium]
MAEAEPARIPAFCTQCRSRCGCDALVADGELVGIEPRPEHPSGAKLCPKGRAAPELVHHPDRLTRPLRRTAPKGAADPGWRPISWDEALDEIAGRLGAIRDAHGAEQVAFSVTTPSGTHMSDGIAWVERFIRGFGSPNTIYSTEICNWHKDVASRFTYGWDIGTPDFAESDLMLLWGWNPAATWLARSVEIQKALKRGAKLIVVDPRPTLYARHAECWLRVRPGTDQALALGLAHLMLEGGGFDAAFARHWTNGPFLVRDDTGRFLRQSDLEAGGSEAILLAAPADDAGERLLRYDAAAGRWLDPAEDAALFARQSVRTAQGAVACASALQRFADAAAEWPPARAAETTGVPEEAMRQAAALLAESRRTAYYAWNGIGQSVTAAQTDRALSILYGLTGCYGRAGGNVPGGAAAFNDISGQELLSDAQRAKALGLAERPLGPGRSGWVTARDVYRAVLQGDPYPVRMLVSFGGNLLSAQPDGAQALAAFQALDFHVHVDFFENASAAHADILLPAATSWEREGLRAGFDNSLEGLRRVQLRPAVVPPVGEARSDVDIVMQLSEKLGMDALMFGGDSDAGHDHMLAPAGLTVAALRARPEGVELPGVVRREPYRDAGFPTPTRRLEIYSEALREADQPPLPRLDPGALEPEAPDAAFPLRLGCAKSLIYCHSQHRNIAALRRRAPDPMLEMAPETAAACDLSDGDWALVETRAGRFAARVKLAPDCAPDSVFAQHGWTVPLEGIAGAPAFAANMNAAVPTDRTDPISGSIPMRAGWCALRRLTPGGG